MSFRCLLVMFFLSPSKKNRTERKCKCYWAACILTAGQEQPGRPRQVHKQTWHVFKSKQKGNNDACSFLQIPSWSGIIWQSPTVLVRGADLQIQSNAVKIVRGIDKNVPNHIAPLACVLVCYRNECNKMSRCFISLSVFESTQNSIDRLYPFHYPAEMPLLAFIYLYIFVIFIYLPFPLLKCEVLLFFSIWHHCKLNIFGFGSVGQTKTIWRSQLVLGFYFFLTFFKLGNQCRDEQIMLIISSCSHQGFSNGETA